MKVHEAREDHMGQGMNLCILPQFGEVLRPVCRKVSDWVRECGTVHPRWETRVELRDFFVELRDCRVRRVLGAKRDVDEFAEDDPEAELVVVPASVREGRVGGIVVGRKWRVAGLRHLTVICIENQHIHFSTYGITEPLTMLLKAYGLPKEKHC